MDMVKATYYKKIAIHHFVYAKGQYIILEEIIMILDKVRGSLIGGAIGDVLGYPVEFCNYNAVMDDKVLPRLDLKPYWQKDSENLNCSYGKEGSMPAM